MTFGLNSTELRVLLVIFSDKPTGATCVPLRGACVQPGIDVEPFVYSSQKSKAENMKQNTRARKSKDMKGLYSTIA